MKITDTHTHVYSDEFDNDRDEVMARAIEAGVNRLVLPACDITSIAPMRDMADRWPEHIRLPAGIHPTELGDNPEAQFEALEAELSSNRHDYVAIGEIGVDLYWDKSRRAEQLDFFGRQLHLAARLGLPVIIHCREALTDTLDVIAACPINPRAVFHSFSGTPADVARIREVAGPDTMFGINGVVTFKNCHVADSLPAIGISRLMLETDAPYLSPVPKRGRRNEPAHIVHTLARCADVFGVAPERLADATTDNATDFFNL